MVIRGPDTWQNQARPPTSSLTYPQSMIELEGVCGKQVFDSAGRGGGPEPSPFPAPRPYWLLFFQGPGSLGISDLDQ